MADKEDPKRQLSVHGITTRFLNAANAVTQLREVHEEIIKHGYRFRPQDIVGSRITSNNTSGGQTETIRVTYNSESTKSKVKVAAKTGKVWDLRQNQETGKETYFKEPTYSKKSQLTRKRPREDSPDRKDPKPKRARKRPDPDPAVGESEEKKEEDERIKFVEKVLREEQKDEELAFKARQTRDELYSTKEETAFKARQLKDAHEKAEADKNRECHERQKCYEVNLDRQRQDTFSAEDITRFVRDARNMASPGLANSPNDAQDELNGGINGEQRDESSGTETAESDVEHEWVNKHDQYKQKVLGRIEAQPTTLSNQDSSNHSVSDQGPSPLYIDEGEEDSNQEPANYTPPRKVVLETDDEEDEEEELIQIDNRRRVVHGVVQDLVQRVISESPPRRVILEETQRRTPVKDRLGVRAGGERHQNRNVAQRTPQGSGGLDPEEKSRRAPLNRRIGKTNTERTSAQETLSLKERLGKRSQSSAFERIRDPSPVAANSRNRSSRSDRNTTGTRESIPRWVKARAKARENFRKTAGKPPKKESSKLDIELVGFSFPARDATTSDSESE